ncbi:MAG: HlyD family efflux transporter periplasmic adaptor subunit [Hyphomicrobium sp.]
MTRSAPRAPAFPRLNIKAPTRLGLAVVIAFFGLGVGGAAISPIDKGVGVPGTIIVESKVKPVAHQRGGTIGTIRVVEGQRVNAGDVIATLETDTLDEQVTALKAQSAAAEKQLELARQEAATISDLQERKLAAKSKALALDRMVAEIEKELAGIKARLAAAMGDRRRADIVAPVAGRVLTLMVHAAGAVVQAGATVAEIVPEDDRLVVEGRLSPHQLENVKPGMEAKVWLSASSWREQRPLAARLSWISADSVEDRRTGTSHFIARIELDDSRADITGRMALQPGMRADVLLMTGRSTLLDQLIDPLMRNIHKAFQG